MFYALLGYLHAHFARRVHRIQALAAGARRGRGRSSTSA